MGMLGDLVGSLVDMGELSNITKTLEPEIKELISSGKCPEELSKAFEAVKNATGGSVDVSKTLDNLISLLEKHSDLFSDTIKNNLPKMKSVVEDLIKKASDIQKTTSK